MEILLEDFITSLEPQEQNYRYTAQVAQSVPIYDGDMLRTLSVCQIAELQREWAQNWLEGVGVIAISGFYAEAECVQAMTDVMLQLLHQEQRNKSQVGDHFSQASNGRLWNALEKVAMLNPEVFIDYYQNPLLRMVAEAWLGPDYTVTSQVNLVPPGGSAQQPHRDYHLGFQDDNSVRRFPLHAQIMSACLTLQGAVVHVDMPIESGPTRILPYSQRYERGYQLYRNDDFKTYFDENAIQLPLALGDAVFFNPALMHGAGENRSNDIQRIANLLQISSAFGKPMEALDHGRMQLACFDAMKARRLDAAALDTLVTVLSDNYPFPTNLDRDAPVDSMTPTSGKQLLRNALQQDWSKIQLEQALEDYRWRRCSA